MRKRLWVLLAFAIACSKQPEAPEAKQASDGDLLGDSAPVEAKEPAAPAVGASTLLLAQAQFAWEQDASGKRMAKPGPAKLLMLTAADGAWQRQVLEDADSRVFHKAMCVKEGDALSGILTIGGTEALLKLWQPSPSGWQAQTLWHGQFGGKWDRLRDVELADLDGDGTRDLVIGTHDQGVIVTARHAGGKWEVEEIFRKANTFIHEIELGDVLGKGKPQIYATPSEPNKANASQAGGIMMFERAAGGWRSAWVDRLTHSHAKEILVTDLDGDGRDELYAAIEAELAPGSTTAGPVEIRAYGVDAKGKWKGRTIAKLERGVQSRVLLRANLTGEGAEIIVTTMKDGVWRLVPAKGDGAWRAEQIDATSTGFENAAAVADVDGDGREELYVSADDQDEVRRYTWNGKTFDRTVIAGLEKSDITWNIVQCR